MKFEASLIQRAALFLLIAIPLSAYSHSREEADARIEAASDSVRISNEYLENGTDTIPTIDLDELTVTGSYVVGNATGYHINVGKKGIVKGKNANELLNFLPNLTEEEGVLKINGLAAHEVIIDGRKVSDLSELRNIPAELIESVDVRYTAGADKVTNTAGGIISIKLKKVPTKGFYGSLKGNIDAAYRNGVDIGGMSGMINGRFGKFSIFEALWGSLLDLKEWHTDTEVNPSGQVVRNLLDRIKSKQISNSMSLNYEINDKHNIGLNWYLGVNDRNSRNLNDDNDALLMKSHSKEFSNMLTLNYSGTLSQRDRLTVSGEWMMRNYDENQSQPSETVSQPLADWRLNSDLWKFSADLQHNFTASHTFNVGAVYNATDSRIRRENVIHVGDNKDLRQNVLAQTPLVYASMQGSFGKVSYYGGLNWQMNSVKVTGEKANIQNSINPTVQFSVPLGKNRITLLYKHILDNIPYDAITEKKVWSDPYNYTIGNKDLKAPTEHYVSVTAGLLDSRINLSAIYWHDMNVIYWPTFNDPQIEGVSYTKPVNMDSNDFYALVAELNYRFFGCWTLKAVGRVSFNTENSELSGQLYNKTRLRQYYSLSNSVNLRKGWGFSVNAYVEPTYKYYDRTYHTVYQVNCSVYKTLFDNTLQIRADFQPFGKRRTLDRMSEDRKLTLKYTTPVQHFGIRITWYFRGGKRDVNVNVRQSTIDYREVRDTF